MANEINLANGKRAERKLLITVAEWDGTKYGGTSKDREVLGTRTEESSIELNPDIEKITDIRGITYTDVNKTEPQQTFDPFSILGGSKLGSYLTQAMLKNDISAYNNAFDIYVITAFIGGEGEYYAVKHTKCTIVPTSVGGDSWVSMPIEVHFSNDIIEGTVDSGTNGKLSPDFVFTPKSGTVNLFGSEDDVENETH